MKFALNMVDSPSFPLMVFPSRFRIERHLIACSSRYLREGPCIPDLLILGTYLPDPPHSHSFLLMLSLKSEVTSSCNYFHKWRNMLFLSPYLLCCFITICFFSVRLYCECLKTRILPSLPGVKPLVCMRCWVGCPAYCLRQSTSLCIFFPLATWPV